MSTSSLKTGTNRHLDDMPGTGGVVETPEGIRSCLQECVPALGDPELRLETFKRETCLYETAQELQQKKAECIGCTPCMCQEECESIW